MKKHLFMAFSAVLFAFSALLPSHLLAQSNFGLGIIVGEPTGISAKTWLNDHNAVDGAVAWSVNENARFQVHADYLYHRNYLFATEDLTGRIPFYFGIGGRMRMAERGDDRLGVRFPLGITTLLRQAPIEFFLEVVPVMDLAPDTDFDINGAIGARWWFNR